MGVKWFKTDLLDFSSEISLRNDFKYINSLIKESNAFYYYREIFDFISYTPTNLDELEEFLYTEIGDVSKNGEVIPVKLSFLDRNEENESLFKKVEKGDIIKPIKGDILISKIRPYLNKVVLIDETNEDVFFTKAFIHIRPKINSEILYFALRTLFFNQLNAVSRQGKGYPTLKEDDIKSIRFAKHTVDSFKKEEANILPQIHQLKNEITNLKNYKLKSLDIINQVFGEEFGFDWQFYKEFGKGMTAGTQQSDVREKAMYQVSLSQIAKSNILRISSRFHSPKTQFLDKILFSKKTLKVKNIISEIVKGVQPDYDTEGEIPVVKIANLKNSYINLELPELVSQTFFDNLKDKQKLQANDVLICCTGKVSLGKVDLFDLDIEAVLTVDNYLIRLKENYNQLFFVYFLRSILGTFQIERDFTGATNQIHLYDKQIIEFDIPDFSLAKQAEIVEKIKTQIDAQNVIDKRIAAKQEEINGIIEKAIA